ncbi:MAG: TIGR03936 family radical SAM-associated protein [Bacillota bacterium]
MLNYRFSKSKSAVFISHLDVLRSTNRTLRRMGIDVNYSQGFNPHMLVNLSQPLVTGVKSLSEWASIDTDYEDEKGFIALYNQFSPEGFEALECIITKQKPKLAGKITASDYFIECSKAIKIKDQLKKIVSQEFIIEIEKKGELIKKEAQDLIYSVNADEKGIYARMCFGNRNLRVDKFCQSLNKNFDLQISLMDITRQSQLIEKDNGFITVSQYLKGL